MILFPKFINFLKINQNFILIYKKQFLLITRVGPYSLMEVRQYSPFFVPLEKST